MMHLEADVFRKFDKQWALVTAGTPEHYNTMTISWGAWRCISTKDCMMSRSP